MGKQKERRGSNTMINGEERGSMYGWRRKAMLKNLESK